MLDHRLAHSGEETTGSASLGEAFRVVVLDTEELVLSFQVPDRNQDEAGSRPID
jgi:hypothetical protein